MTALQGVWARAQEEFREFQAAGSGSKEPEHLFCSGYLFGVAFGLALSTVRPDLVRSFAPQFRKRGWLKEHESWLKGHEKN
jgi:hypothetical protein